MPQGSSRERRRRKPVKPSQQIGHIYPHRQERTKARGTAWANSETVDQAEKIYLRQLQQAASTRSKACPGTNTLQEAGVQDRSSSEKWGQKREVRATGEPGISAAGCYHVLSGLPSPKKMPQATGSFFEHADLGGVGSQAPIADPTSFGRQTQYSEVNSQDHSNFRRPKRRARRSGAEANMSSTNTSGRRQTHTNGNDSNDKSKKNIQI